MLQNIIVNGSQTWRTGRLLQPQEVNKAAADGATVLAYDADGERIDGLATWSRRDFGGVSLDSNSPAVHGNVVGYVRPGSRNVVWAAGLSLPNGVVGPSGLPGRLVLAAGSSGLMGHPRASVRPSTPPIDTNRLQIDPRLTEWVITGAANIDVATAGHYEFGLWGNSGLMLNWLAVCVLP